MLKSGILAIRLMQLFHGITFLVGALGAVVIVVGLFHAFWMLAKFLFTLDHRNERVTLDAIRLDLGRYIIVGLEFFIAKDIIETLVLPSWSEVGMLAVIVVIRTILSYFLTKEIHQIERQKIEHRRIDAGLHF